MIKYYNHQPTITGCCSWILSGVFTVIRAFLKYWYLKYNVKINSSKNILRAIKEF